MGCLDELIEDNLRSMFLNENAFTLKELEFLNESKSDRINKVVDKTITLTFQSIKKKSLNIDYSIISNSVGDFTKTKCYPDIYNAINFITRLVSETNSKELRTLINNISKCKDNLVDNKSGFTKAFKERNNLMIMLYNNVGLSLISSISKMIELTIETYKDEYSNIGAKISDENWKEVYKSTPFATIKAFNELEKSGQLNNAFIKLSPKNNKTYNEEVLYNEGLGNLLILLAKGGGKLGFNVGKFGVGKLISSGLVQKVGLVAGIALAVIIIIKNAAYWYYSLRIKIADQLEQISLTLECNLNEGDREKKLKTIERLRKIAKKLQYEEEIAEKKKDDEMDRDDRKVSSESKKEKETSINDELDKDEDDESNDDIDLF